MELRILLLTAVAATVLTTAGAGMALARPDDHGGPGHHDSDRGGDHRGDRGGDRHDGDRGGDRGHWGDRGWAGERDWRGDSSWRGDHDRYWRRDYGARHYVDRDRIFFSLRRHHYDRFLGEPMWYHGRYVVRTYDRRGELIFVEIDPYTGDFLGVIGF